MRNTANAGAAQIIKQVIRKVRRMAKDCGADVCSVPVEDHMIQAGKLLEWLCNWDKRAQAKKGGLGRKKAGK